MIIDKNAGPFGLLQRVAYEAANPDWRGLWTRRTGLSEPEYMLTAISPREDKPRLAALHSALAKFGDDEMAALTQKLQKPDSVRIAVAKMSKAA